MLGFLLLSEFYNLHVEKCHVPVGYKEESNTRGIGCIIMVSSIYYS
jgi:hypothetical protein